MPKKNYGSQNCPVHKAFELRTALFSWLVLTRRMRGSAETDGAAALNAARPLLVPDGWLVLRRLGFCFRVRHAFLSDLPQNRQPSQ